jgi:hypothetical protein
MAMDSTSVTGGGRYAQRRERGNACPHAALAGAYGASSAGFVRMTWCTNVLPENQVLQQVCARRKPLISRVVKHRCPTARLGTRRPAPSHGRHRRLFRRRRTMEPPRPAAPQDGEAGGPLCPPVRAGVWPRLRLTWSSVSCPGYRHANGSSRCPCRCAIGRHPRVT